MPTSADISQLSDKYVTHFNACIKDSDRMASLILLGKLLKHENCTVEIRRTILRKMDMSFIIRMLNSNSTVTDEEGCSVSLQTVAVSILQHWFCDEELMTSDALLKLLKKFCQIILSNRLAGEDSSSSECVSDVYQSLSRMIDRVEGRVTLLEQHVVPILCQAIVRECEGFEKAVDILKCLSQCHEGVLWDLYATDMHLVIATLANIVRERKDSKTFSYFEDVQVLLLGLSSDFETPPSWLQDLSTTLLNAMKSDIGPPERRQCLRLAAELSRIWAFDWLMVSTPQDAFLLVQMAAIESSVLMEYSVTFEKTFAQADALIPCFSLLETTLQWLSSSSGPPAPDFMSRLIARLDETFAVLSRMLVRWMGDEPEACWRDGRSTAFVYAAARLLGVWLAQDEWAKSESERLPIDVLTAIRDLGCHSLDEEEDDEEDKVDVVRFFLPGLCLTSADEGQRQALITTGWMALIVRYTVNRIKHMRGGVEEISQAICSALNVIFNFLLEGKWLPSLEQLVELVADRWHHLTALSNWKLSLHLVLFLASVLPIQREAVTNQSKLRVLEILLSIFEKVGKSSFGRNACVDKEWEELEGLWLLSTQIYSDAMENDSDFAALVKASGYSHSLNSLVDGLDSGDPCYKPLAGMKSILLSPSDTPMDQ